MFRASQWMLEDAAAKRTHLLDEIVFAGGATLGVFINDPGAAPPRVTIDVDVIAEIATPMDYFDFSERLRSCGFVEDSREDAPACRWLHGELVLDGMPLDKRILGLSNRWYPDALKAAQTVLLPNRQPIKVITAPYFLGTKIEAFCNRGKGDFYSSRDLEDLVSVIDGRDTLFDELNQVPQVLRIYLAEAAALLLSEPRFLDALPGYLLPDEISQNSFAPSAPEVSNYV